MLGSASCRSVMPCSQIRKLQRHLEESGTSDRRGDPEPDGAAQGIGAAEAGPDLKGLAERVGELLAERGAA
ncbi:MAG: hypothetical protein K6V36_05745, partial [Anaerolineae bacterium]|nr:hypothetical protein [Anaerolineae bacterium]